MVYTRAQPDDEAEHIRHHKSFVSGLRFTVSSMFTLNCSVVWEGGVSSNTQLLCYTKWVLLACKTGVFGGRGGNEC